MKNVGKLWVIERKTFIRIFEKNLILYQLDLFVGLKNV